nr:protein FMC1 homolog [Ciona intestinalis]|eukprot:XP_026693971.1 protein FMC1 homolog [Ciona intestinalis]
MASVGKLNRLSTLRGILKELKTTGSKNEATTFLLNKYKSNQITDGKHCREADALNHDASSYYCLLRSTREYKELCDRYHSGEGSTEGAAKRVGLKLPNLYKEGTKE